MKRRSSSGRIPHIEETEEKVLVFIFHGILVIILVHSLRSRALLLFPIPGFRPPCESASIFALFLLRLAKFIQLHAFFEFRHAVLQAQLAAFQLGDYCLKTPVPLELQLTLPALTLSDCSSISAFAPFICHTINNDIKLTTA